MADRPAMARREQRVAPQFAAVLFCKTEPYGQDGSAPARQGSASATVALS
jgi:ribosomal protein L4